MRLGRTRRWVSYRLRHANPPLLLAGVGCLAAASLRVGLTLGGVSVSALQAPWQQAALAIVGVSLVSLAGVVGVPIEPGRPSEGFLGAAPRRPTRLVRRPEALGKLVQALRETPGPIALMGMGGAGKTVLATLAVRERRVQRRFGGRSGMAGGGSAAGRSDAAG